MNQKMQIWLKSIENKIKCRNKKLLGLATATDYNGLTALDSLYLTQKGIEKLLETDVSQLNDREQNDFEHFWGILVAMKNVSRKKYGIPEENILKIYSLEHSDAQLSRFILRKRHFTAESVGYYEGDVAIIKHLHSEQCSPNLGNYLLNRPDEVIFIDKSKLMELNSVGMSNNMLQGR